MGQFVAFFGATASLYPSLKNFNGLWGGLQNAVASAERCFEILDTVDPMVDASGAVELGPLQKSLEFKEVSFEYVPGHPVLRKEISFSVAKGRGAGPRGALGRGKNHFGGLDPAFLPSHLGADPLGRARISPRSKWLPCGPISAS